MKTTSTNSGKAAPADGESPRYEFPLSAYYNSELLWAPYRHMSKLMLDTHNNAATIMEIHRTFADEFRSIVRREQDAMREVLEKMLRRLTDDGGIPENAGTITSDSFSELYESAVTGARELGKAMTDAQARSIEVLREHALAAVDSSSHPGPEHRAAA